jgi:hypothetical protein
MITTTCWILWTPAGVFGSVVRGSEGRPGALGCDVPPQAAGSRRARAASTQPPSRAEKFGMDAGKASYAALGET